MKLTSSKRSGSHHLPCLSGLSQTPLIGGNNNNERLTPISAQTLQSPTRIPPLNMHSTPAIPQIGIPSSSFFPPLPPRSSPAFTNDDTYHVYHEPVDLDEEANLQNNRKPADDVRQRPQQSLLPHPLNPKLASVVNAVSQMAEKVASVLPTSPVEFNNNNNNNNNNSNNNNSSSGYNNNGANTQNNIRARPGRTFTERVNQINEFKQSSKISDDVYSQYVSLKSTERSNNRSRSYHGPKNPTNNHLREQFAYPQTTTRNISSSSVAELPVSPGLFASSSTMPIVFRDHCIRELIDTEANYVQALDMILTRFAKPLELWLKREQSQLIFGHIRYFHHVHSSLHGELVKAATRSFSDHLASPNRKIVNGQNEITVSNPTTPTTPGPINQNVHRFSPLASPSELVPNSNRAPKISACFLNVREKFLKYSEYCASLSKAQALLDELSKNEAIAMQLNRCQQEANEDRFKLRDLLSLPMQRILKYHLFLAQMIKNTNSTNDDYQGLKKAHETLVDLGQYINEVKRDTEAMQIINDVEQSIVGLNMPANTKLEDYGRLIMDGTIRVRGPYEQSRIKLPNDALVCKRYVFVFDKVILMCKKNGFRRYQYKEALVLNDCDLEINPSNLCETLGKHKEKYGYNFNLVRTSDRATYSFYPKSQEAKSKWISSVQKAIDNIKPSACRNTSHKFLMHTFDKASSCDHCGKLLLGLYYQGYRCQVCFASIHKKCIASVKSCGPTLPSKLNLCRTSNRFRQSNVDEPASPLTRSSGIENGQNFFMQCLPPISSSTQCIDQATTGKIEYSNLNNRLVDAVTSPLRESNDSKLILQQQQQRPASSMINLTTDRANSYVNFMLEDLPWFCGRMEREEAENLLRQKPHETFLVRVSPKHNGNHVISLNYHSKIMHIRIRVSDDNRFYLDEEKKDRYFKSIIELVSFYEENSLQESFKSLDVRLLRPFTNRGK